MLNVFSEASEIPSIKPNKNPKMAAARIILQNSFLLARPLNVKDFFNACKNNET